MGLFEASMPICPGNQHCSEWAKKIMNYCLCNAKDGVSLALGMISVVSWGVAEIPQIITNYREKSAEGLSAAFLFTWILGDLFNVFGCILEPATLPTQYYMALLYTITTGILGAQTLYFGYIYPQLKYRQRQQKIEAVDRFGQSHGSVNVKQFNEDGNKFDTSGMEDVSSRPIPLPMIQRNSSMGRELYYMSARSLSSSHTPTAGSFLIQRMTPPSHMHNPIQEPLLDGNESSPSASPPSVKSMLCVVSMLTFFGTLNLHQSAKNGLHSISDNPNQGFVFPGRNLLQVAGEMLQNNVNEGSSGIGTYLGWGMAAIYMGGRLPQICLNIRRGNVEGLNPLMFIFALVGNSTYVASILVSSTDWSRIGPNLPWLVDACGCVLLDTFILLQFIYFHYWIPRNRDDKLVPFSTV